MKLIIKAKYDTLIKHKNDEIKKQLEGIKKKNIFFITISK